jgi:hypothetical protein
MVLLKQCIMVRFKIMKPIKIVLLINFVLLISSCKESTVVKEDVFLEFDKVEYFYKDISEENVFNLYDSQNKEDSLRFQLITSNNPETLDVNYKQVLKQFDYKEQSLTQVKKDSIKTIFSNAKCVGKSAYGCLPIYRDVLFLYKENKLIGIAKIALDCHQTYIVETDEKKDNIGLCSNEYPYLKKLLR